MILLWQAAEKSYWCQRPNILNETSPDLWRNISKSYDNCNVLNFEWNSLTLEQIKVRYRITNVQIMRIYLKCILPHPQSGSLIPNATALTTCKAWEFDPDDNLGNTWSSQWNLVCDKDHLKNVAEMFFLAGVATGGIISGVLSDKFGRKKMLFISAVLQSIFGEYTH